jgi:PEGA domain-containing protein
MLTFLKRAVALLLCCSMFAYAGGNSFKVRYNGGSVASKVDAKDWGNTLSITADSINLQLKDGVKVDIAPKSVTSLSYGQEAHRRVGTMVALAVLVAPVALFGLFHKTRLHYIGVQYKTDGKDAGILLQGDKDNYRAILVALQGVTGAPVSVGQKDREFIPVGVTTTVAKDSESSDKSASPSKESVLPDKPEGSTSATAQVEVVSTPTGADIEVDGKFVGSTPSTLSLPTGDHDIAVKKTGFTTWTRKISVSGGHVNISAELTPESK